MTAHARLYAEGTDTVEDVDLASFSGPVRDHAILWVDVGSDGEDLARLDALGLREVAAELAETDGGGIAFRGETIRLSVVGLRDGPDVTHARIGFILARNVVVTVHEEPVRGLADPIKVMAHDP